MLSLGSLIVLFTAIGASSDPCSLVYAGPFPYSEPETRAMSDFILSLEGTWKLYLTLHSYKQLWMLPWGYSKNLVETHDKLVWPNHEAYFLTYVRPTWWKGLWNILYGPLLEIHKLDKSKGTLELLVFASCVLSKNAIRSCRYSQVAILTLTGWSCRVFWQRSNVFQIYVLAGVVLLGQE